MNSIHPTAIVSPGASMGTGNTIGPFAVIAADVVLGNDNWIGSGVLLGAPPEVRSFAHDDGWLDTPASGGVVIGDGNVLREGVQVHAGWAGTTHIGDGSFIMNTVYIAHDGVIGDGATLSAKVALGGHVRIGDGATIGMAATVHQRRVVGAFSMIGMSSAVTRDIPPFSKAYGVPCRERGINSVGMSRAGFSADDVEWVTSEPSQRSRKAPEAVSRVLEAYEAVRAH